MILYKRLKQDFLNFHLKVYNHMERTKHETCAALHRFHVFYISFDCDNEAHIRGSWVYQLAINAQVVSLQTC